MARKPKVVKLKEVLEKIRRNELKDFRQSFKEATDNIFSQVESPVGYAVVMWDKKGEIFSDYDVREGVIGLGLMPTLVKDKLNRQITQDNLIINMTETNLDS